MKFSYHGAPLAALCANTGTGETTRVARPANRPRLIAVGIVVFALSLLIPNFLMAQVQNGSITGRVTDATGAVLAEAGVTVTQTSTGLVLHGVTNNDGTYQFPQLQPAPYHVTVEKAGFKKTGTSVTLTVGQTAQIDITLPVGNQTETVNVEGEASVQTDTQTSNLDFTVQSEQVNDLPLNGRNPYGWRSSHPVLFQDSILARVLP